MAAVDALSLSGDSGRDLARWTAAGALALALHASIFLLMREAPRPASFESQVPIEMDLLPPPAGAAQMSESGADATTPMQAESADEEQPTETTPTTEPDQAQDAPQEADALPEINDDETPPPSEMEEAVVAETPEELAPIDALQAEQVEDLPEVAAAPPDVTPTVALPPEETVARDVTPEPKPQPKPQAQPKPKPVAKKPVERPVARREEPTPRRPERADRPKAPAAPAQQAGGRGGASANAGAARAAASAFGGRVRAAVAAQKKSGSLSGRAVVSFTVSRSGAVSGVSASGPGPVAAEAAAMVRRAGIPAMPAEMTGSSARYTLPISFTAGR